MGCRHQIYFEKVHPSIPVVHRPRYLAASNLAPSLRPPVYLQYIMWCHAASINDKYHQLHGHFYQRARKYAELEEMKGLGENILSLAYCQTWLLIATYESKMLYFPRAWLSTGRCARMALMMGLNRLDGAGLNVKQSLPPPKDWTEREGRRRLFWMIFCCDRYASIGTSWPMAIDERDVRSCHSLYHHSRILTQPTDHDKSPCHRGFVYQEQATADITSRGRINRRGQCNFVAISKRRVVGSAFWKKPHSPSSP